MATNGRKKPHSISVAFFNCDGIRHNRPLFSTFLKEHNVDVLMVQETFLKPSHRNPSIAGYRFIRTDRISGPLGGTGIYYRASLHCVELPVPELESLEVTALQIGMSCHEDIVLVSAYHSGSKQMVLADYRKVLALGRSVLIAGDLNSKHTSWNSRNTNLRGVRLLSVIDQSPGTEVLAPIDHTFYPRVVEHQSDVLDIAILKNIGLRVQSMEVIHELLSDHRPVLIRLGNPETSVAETKRVTDWNRLHDSLKECPPSIGSLASRAEVNAAFSCFSDELLVRMGEFTREVPASDPNIRWKLSPELSELVRRKNAAFRAAARFPSPQFRSRANAYRRLLCGRMAEERNERWGKTLEELEPGHTEFWRLTAAFNRTREPGLPPLIGPDGSLAFTDLEKAECLADSLSEQCTLSARQADDEHVAHVEQVVADKLSQEPTQKVDEVSADEIIFQIRRLKDKKAPGYDRIRTRFLKSLPENIIAILVILFNAALDKSVFPSVWKHAEVFSLRKPGKDRGLPSSYRPISLLSIPGKIFEAIVHRRLLQSVESLGILRDEQFGFRAGHSCTHQVHRLVEYCLGKFSMSRRCAKHKVGAVFFDIAKAFDKVWHEGLLYKLIRYEIPDSLIHLIRDFLSDRTFSCRVEGTLSSRRGLGAGVPQGSVLSPLLFALFANDMPLLEGVELALFADDTVLYFYHRSVAFIVRKLQRAVNLLEDWFLKWRIEVNPLKSQAIMFSGNRARLMPNSDLSLLSRQIPWCTRVKYLGVWLDRRLSFSYHISEAVKRASQAMGRIGWLIGRRSRMSLRNKLTIYKSFILPVMTYASPVWAHAAPWLIEKLRRRHNKCIRTIAGSPWYVRNSIIHRDLKIKSFRQLLHKYSFNYFRKADRHTNPLVREASNYLIDGTELRRRPKAVLSDPTFTSTAGSVPDQTPEALQARPSATSQALQALPGPSAQPVPGPSGSSSGHQPPRPRWRRTLRPPISRPARGSISSSTPTVPFEPGPSGPVREQRPSDDPPLGTLPGPQPPGLQPTNDHQRSFASSSSSVPLGPSGTSRPIQCSDPSVTLNTGVVASPSQDMRS